MIDKDDYVEPACLLLDEQGQMRCREKINIKAVIAKLDDLYDHEEYEQAKKVINYWLEEANMLKDERSAFTMYDEAIGLSRKTGDKEWGLFCIEKAFKIAENVDIIDKISIGTVYLNGATTLKAFGKIEEALPYYEMALTIFNEKLEKNDYRFASLFNNYALALSDLGKLDKAEQLFEKAVEITSGVYPLELAITYTNLSDLYYKKNDLDKCDSFLNKAFEIIENFKGEKDGYYAFVLKKCATAFSYHGFFREEELLLAWADEAVL